MERVIPINMDRQTDRVIPINMDRHMYREIPINMDRQTDGQGDSYLPPKLYFTI